MVQRAEPPGALSAAPTAHGHVSESLAAQDEPFDSFWEAPADVDRGFVTFGRFYRANYLSRLSTDRSAPVLVISSGYGYFLDLLRQEGFTDVLGIDSDAEKISAAQSRGFACRQARAFEHLEAADQRFEMIVCEQEINHLTKRELVQLLKLSRSRLRPGGRIIVHSLNGANPITGADALAQNFDHQHTLTEYSLRQVLKLCGFRDVEVFPLDLYVFWTNPLNYVAWALAALHSLCFRFWFVLYGKKNRLWTKKIGAVGFA